MMRYLTCAAGTALLTGILLARPLWAGELMDAVKKGEPTEVEHALKASPAEVNLADENGGTPLHWAAKGSANSQSSSVPVVQLLLAGGADLKARDAYGNSPLHLAALRGDTGVVETLVRAGADAKAVAFNRYTPLHLAAWSGNAEVAKLLIDKGAEVKAQ
ncbi:MAG: ankyrin repeat domain-containing protein, partial [Armatimonadetes bacterium]|nr:ankyrin repeat domain-containing protein [Armatimonadota bacterium]